MPRLIVSDSGGASRVVRRLFVVDSGGSPRLIRRAFVIDAGGAARQFFSGEPTISLAPSYSVDDSAVSPFTATANFRLTNTGLIQQLTSFGTSTIGSWIDDTSLAGNYEARATLVSGTLSTGTAGVYQALSSTLTWGVSRGSTGSKSCTFTLEIRKTSTGVVMDSSTVIVTASVDA